jgi:putative IMPACT (imprinted ancient) family translation regulator
MEILNESRRVRQATHNILAYRVTRATRDANATPTFYQDHDDDGESAAGGRLLRLLALADARDVVVVVSRWYGGTHLGPARFHVINACAKETLAALGQIRA